MSRGLDLQAVFHNGSLWPQLHGNYILNSITPSWDENIGINITTFPNRTTDLRFLDTGHDLALALPLFAELVRPGSKASLVGCTFPLSGQYDHLPRALFYACLVFAVMLRHRTWLAEAALGVAMSYSATACIHLFLLLGFYDFGLPEESKFEATSFGDVDFWGIAPVIACAAILMIPVMHWSRTYQFHRGKPLFVAWGLLIMSSFLIVCYYAYKYFDYEWIPVFRRSLALCEQNCTLDYLPIGEKNESYSNPPIIQVYQNYTSDSCNCIDFCASIPINAPLRRNTGMVASLGYKRSFQSLCEKNDPDCSRGVAPGVFSIISALGILWIIALVFGFLALLSSDATTETTRNRIFKVLNCDLYTITSAVFKGSRRDRIIKRLHLKESPRDTLYRKLRRGFAKTVAALYYMSAVLGLVLYPIIFLISIVVFELSLGTFVVSEHSDAVGAWAPCVTAGFIIFADIIRRNQRTLSRFISGPFIFIIRKIQYDEDDPDRHITEEKPVSKSRSLADWREHVDFEFKNGLWVYKVKLRMFKAWWEDPEDYSSHDDNDLIANNAINDEMRRDVEKTFLKDRPECSCMKCMRHKRCKVIPGDSEEEEKLQSPESEEEALAPMRAEAHRIPMFSRFENVNL